MASISRAVAAIKRDPQHFITGAQVRRACEAAGHQGRDRILIPVVTPGPG